MLVGQGFWAHAWGKGILDGGEVASRYFSYYGWGGEGKEYGFLTWR